MHEIVTQLNNLVVALNGLNPYWYIVLAAPIITAAQHFIKAEQNFEQTKWAKKHGLLVSLVLTFLTAGFYAVFKTHTVLTFLRDTGLVGSPIYLISNALFQKVAQPIEKYRVSQQAQQPDVLAPALPQVDAAPAAAISDAEV